MMFGQSGMFRTRAISYAASGDLLKVADYARKSVFSRVQKEQGRTGICRVDELVQWYQRFFAFLEVVITEKSGTNAPTMS